MTKSSVPVNVTTAWAMLTMPTSKATTRRVAAGSAGNSLVGLFLVVAATASGVSSSASVLVAALPFCLGDDLGAGAFFPADDGAPRLRIFRLLFARARTVSFPLSFFLCLLSVCRQGRGCAGVCLWQRPTGKIAHERGALAGA
nr:hypothetical protein [Pandoravirus belohorizontensis]